MGILSDITASVEGFSKLTTYKGTGYSDNRVRSSTWALGPR